MKWKVDSPKHGDTRTRQVFAWQKTKVDDYCVWFETYQITEKYISADGNETRWHEVSRQVLDYAY
jgi:hypothetical protein